MTTVVEGLTVKMDDQKFSQNIKNDLLTYFKKDLLTYFYRRDGKGRACNNDARGGLRNFIFTKGLLNSPRYRR